MVHRRALLVAMLAIASIAAGCGSGQIRSEQDAVAAARRISGLSEPITILDVHQGPAGRVFNGPVGAVPDEFIAAERAKRARPAWAVEILGFVHEPCADSVALLPCGLVRMELVIDRETGQLLYSVMPG